MGRYVPPYFKGKFFYKFGGFKVVWHLLLCIFAKVSRAIQFNFFKLAQS